MSRGEMTMDVATFLNELCEDLAGCGTTACQLAALEFGADGRDIAVRTRKERRAGSYPDLADIVAGIGLALRAEGIAIAQLRRLTFSDSQVRLELVDAEGRPGACIWPVVYPLADS